MSQPQPNPFNADPAALAHAEGAYVEMRGHLDTAIKPLQHLLTRVGPARVFDEARENAAATRVPYRTLAAAYATALVEIARLRNEADGVTADPLPEWPTDDDPREQARKRVAAFTDALMRLCIDHQIHIHVGIGVAPWLEDMAANDGQGGPTLAARFHWCPKMYAYAATEPIGEAGYAQTDVVPWQVPDGHQ